MTRRFVKGLYLPPSQVMVELRLGEQMPPREEFATTMQRIKSGHGAYSVAATCYDLYALRWPMVITKRQAEKLVAVYPQFEIFGLEETEV